MGIEKKLANTKIFALFIAAFVLTLYLPVNGEEKETRDNPDIKKKLKPKIILIYISPKDIKSSLSPVPKHTNASVKLSREFETRTLENSLFTISLVAFATLNVADYFTTIKALKYEGLKEGNPLMKPFIKKPYLFAAVKISTIALNCKLMKNLYKKNKRIAWVISTISNILLTYVVVNNCRMIQKVQRL